MDQEDSGRDKDDARGPSDDARGPSDSPALVLRIEKQNQQKLTRNSDKNVDIIVAVVELWFGDVVDRDCVALIRVYN